MRISSIAVAATLGLLVGLVVSGCSDDDDDNPGGVAGAAGTATGGTGGMGGTGGTGGTGGSLTGGTGGSLTGGNGGEATGGTGGSLTGGNGGEATGGNAGEATGGNAGEATGGNAGEATGGSAGAATGGTGGGSNCPPITLTNFEAYYEDWLIADVEPNIGGADPDMGSIEFFDSAQAPGTFDLSQGKDNNYATCDRCVRVFEDNDGKNYFQRSGTLTLTSVDINNGLYKGSLKNVELEEVTINTTTWESTPVPNGDCLYIADVSFSTDPTGEACTNHNDCLPSTICDPGTLKCEAFQCSSTQPCSGNNVCWGGAVCMPGCVPFSTSNACGTGETCVINNDALTEGYCQKTGTAGIGQTCTPLVANNTSCVQNAICGQVSQGVYQCVEQCNFFAATGGCSQSSQYCAAGGVCWGGTPVNTTVNGNCPDGDANWIEDCGLENGIAKGVCINPTSPNTKSGMICSKWCLANTDCTSTQTCNKTIFGGDLGVCVAK